MSGSCGVRIDVESQEKLLVKRFIHGSTDEKLGRIRRFCEKPEIIAVPFSSRISISEDEK